jgi:hypothetical protein
MKGRMVMNDFMTLDYVLSFPGMMVICWLMVTLVKNLIDGMFDNHTKWVVLAVAAILVLVKTIVEINGTISASKILVALLMWVINTSVVWFATLKAHELIVEPVTKH